MVDVVQERVQRAHALLEPLRQAVPLAAAEHARDDVEGDQALGIAALRVDREGDADAPEQQLRLAPAQLELVVRRLRQPLVDEPVGRAHAVRLAHLVEAVHAAPPRGCPEEQVPCRVRRAGARCGSAAREPPDREGGSARPHLCRQAVRWHTLAVLHRAKHVVIGCRPTPACDPAPLRDPAADGARATRACWSRRARCGASATA